MCEYVPSVDTFGKRTVDQKGEIDLDYLPDVLDTAFRVLQILENLK